MENQAQTPQPTVVNQSSGEGGGKFGMGLIAGIIVIIAIVLIWMFMGNRGGSAPTDTDTEGANMEVPDTVEIPDEINVNVQGLPDGQ